MRYDINEGNQTAYNRWRWDKPITAQMQALMDAIAAALDRGVSYNTDMNLAIGPLFDWGDTPPLPADGREGGNAISYEIYSARSRLREIREAAKERETFAALDLRPGQNLGTLPMTGGRIKRLNNATVQAAEIGKITLKGTAGGRHFTATLTATSLATKLAPRPAELL